MFRFIGNDLGIDTQLADDNPHIKRKLDKWAEEAKQEAEEREMEKERPKWLDEEYKKAVIKMNEREKRH